MTNGRAGMLPKTPIGWWALGVAVVAVASWVVLPVTTVTFRDTYPITDTWVMPAIGTTLTDAAAILGVLAIWRRREQSALNVGAAVVTVLAGAFFTFMVVGEAIGGA
jgi:hypothetical protein